MKKVNLKQITNVIRTNATTIRDNSTKAHERMEDSQLYMNITQKLLKDQ